MSARLRAFIALPALLAESLTAVVATGRPTAPAADAATSTTPTTRPRATTGSCTRRDIALHQLGDPYLYGAAGPKAFDCSGLIFFSYRTPASPSRAPPPRRPRHARHIREGAPAPR